MDTSILQQVFTFDEEQWKDIPGYEGYYQASNHGRVRSVDRVTRAKLNGTRVTRGRMSNYKMRPSGHHAVSLSVEGKASWVFVHRLIYMAFMGPIPDGHDVHHINEIKTDNHVGNLVAMSHSDHMTYHSTSEKCPVRGERNSHNVLSREQVLEVVGLLDNSTLSQQEIAERYGVNARTVNCINTGTSWNWLTSRRSMPTISRRSRNLKLTDEDVASIKARVESGIHKRTVAQEYSVSEGHINRIVAGYR